MKKKIWIPIVAVVVLLLVLFVPYSSEAYLDGGTRTYTALTYKIVDWNRISGNGIYDDTKIYFFPNNFKSLDELWELEKHEITYPTLKAKVIEVYENSVLVEAIDNKEGQPSGQITFDTSAFENITLITGDIIEVVYSGLVMETYPSQITVLEIEFVDDIRDVMFNAEWLDEATTQSYDEKYPAYPPYDNNTFENLVITKIYANCFFAENRVPQPFQYKINGKLGEGWCVGDQINCVYKNAYTDDLYHVEADMVSIESSDWEPDPNACYKPVIYLYPEEETEITVSLTLDGEFTCTYPAYNNGWTVTALPNGTLIDKNGQTYNYLYWEGETYSQYDLSSGFCVKGDDTAMFLETALSDLGLNRREANEFIVYWLPLMEQNPYNIISFQTDVYVNAAKLKINPTPDTLIRVFMTWQSADNFVELPAQDLSAPERLGFTVVEWGGTQLK